MQAGPKDREVFCQQALRLQLRETHSVKQQTHTPQHSLIPRSCDLGRRLSLHLASHPGQFFFLSCDLGRRLSLHLASYPGQFFLLSCDLGLRLSLQLALYLEGAKHKWTATVGGKCLQPSCLSAAHQTLYTAQLELPC